MHESKDEKIARKDEKIARLENELAAAKEALTGRPKKIINMYHTAQVQVDNRNKTIKDFENKAYESQKMITDLQKQNEELKKQADDLNKLYENSSTENKELKGQIEKLRDELLRENLLSIIKNCTKSLTQKSENLPHYLKRNIEDAISCLKQIEDYDALRLANDAQIKKLNEFCDYCLCAAHDKTDFNDIDKYSIDSIRNHTNEIMDIIKELKTSNLNEDLSTDLNELQIDRKLENQQRRK